MLGPWHFFSLSLHARSRYITALCPQVAEHLDQDDQSEKLGSGGGSLGSGANGGIAFACRGTVAAEAAEPDWACGPPDTALT